MACVFTFATGATFIPDAYTTATHDVTTEATAFPIQNGSTVTDHVIVKPRTIKLDLIVSPFSPEPLLLQPPEGEDRPLLSWNLLVGAARTRQPLSLAVDDQVYEPAVILSISRTHVYDDGRSYRFTLEAQEILVATSKTVPAAKLAPPIRHKSATRQRGNQPVNPSQVFSLDPSGLIGSIFGGR